MLKQIKSKVQYILNTTFSATEKKRISERGNVLYFACPFCGDSSTNLNKKRGTIYIDSLTYHCYNCNLHHNLIIFFNKLDGTLLSKEEYEIYKAKIKCSHVKTEFNYNNIKNLLIKHSMKIEDFINVFNLVKIDKEHDFIKKRCLTNIDNVYIDNKNLVYFINKIENNVLAFQTRNINEKRYETYNIESLNKKLLFREINEEFKKTLNKFSVFFNFFSVNFENNVYLCEGPIDALSYNNTIALLSVNNDTSMFENDNNIKYWFDNDESGQKYLIKNIKKNNSIFLWRKFLDFYKLKNIKDINDILKQNYKDNYNYFENINSFFSNSVLDLIYL